VKLLPRSRKHFLRRPRLQLAANEFRNLDLHDSGQVRIGRPRQSTGFVPHFAVQRDAVTDHAARDRCIIVDGRSGHAQDFAA